MVASAERIVRIENPKQLVEVAGHAPAPMALQCEQVTSLDAIQSAEELVVFLDRKDPKAMLEHPIFGDLLKAREDSILEKDKKFSLDGGRITVTVSQEGEGLKKVHFVLEPDVKDAKRRDYDWRKAVASHLSGVVDRVAKGKGENTLGLWVPEEWANDDDKAMNMESIARAVGNLSIRGDLASSIPSEHLKFDGTPQKVETLKAHENPKELDGIRVGVRHQVGLALMSNVAMEDNNPVLHAAQRGDRLSQMQSVAKILTEASHEVLNTETLLRATLSLAAELQNAHPDVSLNIEVIGPEEGNPMMEGVSYDYVTFDDLEMETGRRPGMMEAVHRGCRGGEEKGPYAVRMSYRHASQKGEPVHFGVYKGLYDLGGVNNKTAMVDIMKGDMGGAAIACATLTYLKSRLDAGEPVETNMEIVSGLASNKFGPDAYAPGSVIKTFSGKRVEIHNTDAEGRLVMGDAAAIGMYRLSQAGEKVVTFDSTATLTGAAIQSYKDAVVVVAQDEAILADLRERAALNNEHLAIMPRGHEEKQYLKPGPTAVPADLRNLSKAPLKARGPQTAAEFVVQSAGVTGALNETAVHWDCATHLMRGENDPTDVRGQFTMEFPFKTFVKRATGQIF